MVSISPQTAGSPMAPAGVPATPTSNYSPTGTETGATPNFAPLWSPGAVPGRAPVNSAITGSPLLTGNLINDLTSNITNAVTQYGQSQASALAAQGYGEEATSYTSAAAIARQNETLAGAAGQVEQAQIGLEVGRTIGSQQAGIAAAGFGSGGTALALLRANQRQGTMEKQLAGVNTSLQQAGFEQQATAAEAEARAASTSAATSASLAATSSTVAGALRSDANSIAATLGLNIPGLSTLSATSMPTANAADLMNQLSTPSTLGGRAVGPGNPFVI